MCSLNDYFCEGLPCRQEPTVNDLNGLVCQKCNEDEAAIKLRQKDVYCNKCFLTSATHKFRATLGKSKIVRPTDTILVAYCGGGASTALLHLIRAGMHESVHKRLIFKTKVLHVDDGMTRGLGVDQRQEKVSRVSSQIETLGFESFAVSLGDAMSYSDSSVSPLTSFACSSASDEHLLNAYNDLRDETSRRDFVSKLRYKLIVLAARSLKCNKIFLADTSSSLSVSILSNISLGRGAQLSSDCGFVDNRHGDVMILRPMRDFSQIEIEHYLKICDCKYIPLEDSQSSQSIQGLTEKFVTGLEEQFGGTVSTIFRTGEKISTQKNQNKDTSEVCAFCSGHLDTASSADSASAIEATNFSKIVSLKGADAQFDLAEISEKRENGENCDCSSRGSCCNFKENGVMHDDVRRFLCYGCLRIFHNNFDTAKFPSYVLNSVAEHRRSKIRDEISDFLL